MCAHVYLELSYIGDSDCSNVITFMKAGLYGLCIIIAAHFQFTPITHLAIPSVMPILYADPNHAMCNLFH